VNSLLWFWAKLGSENWPDQYHPALCHLIDVGQVANQMWNSVFRKRVRAWVSARLGLANEEAAGAWLAFWAATHDIGKVTPCFQSQGNSQLLRSRLQSAGFDFPVGSEPHGYMSTKVLTEELAFPHCKWPAVEERVARNVAIAVGGHHGIFPTNWERICSPLGKDCWANARRQILAELARLFALSALAPPSQSPSDDQSIWMYVAGITSVADWIGSNVRFFPPTGNAALVNGQFNLDDYFRKAGCQAVEALQQLGWLGRADTRTPVSFASLFPFINQPRPLQVAVAEFVNQTTDWGLLIIEAPMGEGKTEAGWYASVCWDRCGGQGAYVALPTMATGNQMFDRVGAFLETDAGKKNLMLLHGKAALNDQFEKLKYAALVYDVEKQPSAVVAEEWFAVNKKYGLLASYGVGTIDQALLAVLQTKHVFVRLFGLTGKCVILDEVHAYDAYMTTLMERLLQWLAALGCPVVLLSATLPRDKRLKLLRAYAGDNVEDPVQTAYPRITSVAVGRRPEVRHVEPDPTRAKTVGLGWVDEGRLPELLRESLANGGCAAVIRNTVKLAQATYVQLRNSLNADGIVVELFHARFPFGRRMEIENAVLQRFGKEGGRAERHKRVLVATQVVEQSLDLDFDEMISEVAPVDLVLQRAGRLHRHARGLRPAGVKDPRLWLIKPAPVVPGAKGGIPDLRPSDYVYTRSILLRSFLVLKGLKDIRLPDQLEQLVEQVYGNAPLAISDDWELALQKSQLKLAEEQRIQRSKAKGVMIYRPDDEDLLRQQNAQLDEDNPEAGPRIRAATRDTEPTIQLILVYSFDGHEYLDLLGREPFAEAEEFTTKRIRKLLDNEVTISHRGCFDFYTARPVPPSWRECGMLRSHRLIRIDAFGNSLPTEYPLHFDPEIGLTFIRNIE